MNIESFILVGGRSSRFGADKASFLFDGEPLAARSAAAIRDAFPTAPITLVDAYDGEGLHLDGLAVISDVKKNIGPIGGMQTAFLHARAEWAIMLACDLPLVSSALLTCLASFIADEVDAIAPIQPDGKVQPLCALYRVEPCLRAVESLVDLTDRPPGVIAVLDRVRTRSVAFDELADLPGSADLFLNLNTPEDLARFVALYGGGLKAP